MYVYECMYVCTVCIAPFESATDLQLFCYEEIKRLEDKFRATLMRTLPLVQSNISTPGVVSECISIHLTILSYLTLLVHL